MASQVFLKMHLHMLVGLLYVGPEGTIQVLTNGYANYYSPNSCSR